MSERAPRHKDGDFVRISDAHDVGAFAGERVRIVRKIRADGPAPRPIVGYVCDAEDGTRFVIGKNFLHPLPPIAQCFRGTIEVES